VSKPAAGDEKADEKNGEKNDEWVKVEQ